MDTSGFSQVGRYGTLSLLKRRNSSGSTPGPTPNNLPQDSTPSPEQSQVITSFGIDSANLTFGRAPTCDVRLYYPAVDTVHCRVVNEDGKAFLVVQGKAGALVDGCWVYPHTSSSSSNNGSHEQQQSIIPLTNNSEFEIHGKRFRFTYPPKEVRKVLLSTPVAHRNRTLRLSMIHSAQVFSPRPSHDPRENLKILQSPIKTSIFSSDPSADKSARSRSQSPSKPRAVSPLKFGIAADEEDSDDDEMDMGDEHDENEGDVGRGRTDQGECIVLVHTNHPRVVEEERDLVILEDVPLHLILPSPSVYSAGSPARSGPQQVLGVPGTPTPMQNSAQKGLVQPQPQRVQPQPQPPRTPPRRKSLGGTALHRAVLIRSAQRAVWKAEKEREEEEEREEEMEVLGAVVGAVDVDEGEKVGDEDEDYEQEDVEMRDASDDEEEYTDEEGEDDDNKSEQKPLWRKSLERIIPWPFGSKHEDGDKEDEEHIDGDNDDQEEDENDAPAPLPVMPQQTPARRPLGSFMTPQPQARQSVQQPRKDIFPSTNNAIPATTTTGLAAGPGRYSLGGGEARRVVVQQPWRVRDLVVPPMAQASPAPAPLRSVDPPSTPGGAQFLPSAGTSAAKPPPVTEEERRAIQERRRSAAREFRENPFWKDGAPGMSPAKVSASPAKPNPGLGVGQGLARPSVMATPAKIGPGSIGAGMTPKRPAQASPTKGSSLGYSIAEAEVEEGDIAFLQSEDKAKATPRDENKKVDDDEESLDAHGLLERMRETVENMKRRRSVVPATPKATLKEEVDAGFGMDDRSTRGSIKKLDFTRITPGRRAAGTPFDAAEVTPKGVLQASSSSSPSEPAQPSLDEGEVKEPEPFSLLRPGARPSLAPKIVEEHSAVEEEVHPLPLPPHVVVVDTADDEEPAETKTRGRGRGRPRMLRAPKGEEELTQAEHEDAEEATQAKPKSSAKPDSRTKPPSSSKPRSRSAKSPAPPVSATTGLAPEPSGSGPRRQRSRTPQSRPEVVPEAEVEQEPAATRSGAVKRTRKSTVEPEEPVTEAPVLKRKGRKAAEPEPEPELMEKIEEEGEEAKPAPAKRGRKPRVVAAAVQEEVEEPPAAPIPAKRGRPKKVKEPETAPAPDENAEDDDELDSYEVLPAAAATKKTSKNQIQPATQVKGRKKPTTPAAAVKHEPADDNDEEPAPLATARVGRSGRSNSGAAATKTPAPSGTIKAKIPTTAASKPRGRPKTPASAPAGATAPSAAAGTSAEKENTPGNTNTSGSANGSDDAQEEAAVVKVRVSRRAGANANAGTVVGSGKTAKAAAAAGRVKAKAPVKVEQDDDDEEEVAPAASKMRATRVMRTRTKTG